MCSMAVRVDAASGEAVVDMAPFLASFVNGIPNSNDRVWCPFDEPFARQDDVVTGVLPRSTAAKELRAKLLQ